MTAENDDPNGNTKKGTSEKHNNTKEDEKITQYSDGKDVYRINGKHIFLCFFISVLRKYTFLINVFEVFLR